MIYLAWILITLTTFANYKAAKLVQEFILSAFPSAAYVLSISIPWVLIGLIPCLFMYRRSGLLFDKELTLKNIKSILLYFAVVFAGLALFVLLGITHYFHTVKYPIIFFFVTPVAEELIFRGWIFGQVEKLTKYSPVLITAVLFGLHHLQYFNYVPTRFAIFQVGYTFLIGILLGRMRKQSGSIYLGVLLHMIVNYVAVMF